MRSIIKISRLFQRTKHNNKNHDINLNIKKRFLNSKINKQKPPIKIIGKTDSLFKLTLWKEYTLNKIINKINKKQEKKLIKQISFKIHPIYKNKNCKKRQKVMYSLLLKNINDNMKAKNISFEESKLLVKRACIGRSKSNLII
jgi:hypothetical protein